MSVVKNYIVKDIVESSLDELNRKNKDHFFIAWESIIEKKSIVVLQRRFREPTPRVSSAFCMLEIPNIDVIKDTPAFIKAFNKELDDCIFELVIEAERAYLWDKPWK